MHRKISQNVWSSFRYQKKDNREVHVPIEYYHFSLFRRWFRTLSIEKCQRKIGKDISGKETMKRTSRFGNDNLCKKVTRESRKRMQREKRKSEEKINLYRKLKKNSWCSREWKFFLMVNRTTQVFFLFSLSFSFLPIFHFCVARSSSFHLFHARFLVVFFFPLSFSCFSSHAFFSLFFSLFHFRFLIDTCNIQSYDNYPDLLTIHVLSILFASRKKKQ